MHSQLNPPNLFHSSHMTPNNTSKAPYSDAYESAVRSYVQHLGHTACCALQAPDFPSKPLQPRNVAAKQMRKPGFLQRACTKKQRKTTLTDWRFGADTAHYRSCIQSLFRGQCIKCLAYFLSIRDAERTSQIESLCHSPHLRRLRWVPLLSPPE